MAIIYLKIYVGDEAPFEDHLKISDKKILELVRKKYPRARRVQITGGNVELPQKDLAREVQENVEDINKKMR